MNPPSPGLLLAYAPFAKWSPHYETDLEIIRNHLDAGGRVQVLSCRGELPTCELNPTHEPVICRLCRSRFEDGLAWLASDRVADASFLDLDAEESAAIAELAGRRWASLDEVRAFRIDGADIGLSAVSSLVSRLRESEPDIRQHAGELSAHLASAATVYYSLRRQLGKHRPDLFSVFNARYSSLRPALRAAQQLGVRTWVHERAGYQDRYQLSENTYPHDLGAIKREIESLYPAEGLSEAGKQAARAWFEERRAGVEQSWISFTADQKAGLLPKGLDRPGLSVAIFNSSEDEFVAIEEWRNQFYASQNAGIRALLESFRDEPAVHFYLRVHPNLRGLRNTQIAQIEAMGREFPNLTVIGAESPVSSYALMAAAGLVLSYGSTAGIEACYAGRPSVLMGRAMYEELDICERPGSHEELVDLIRQVAAGRELELPPGHEEGLLKFGHYFRAKGTPFRHVRATGLFSALMLRDGVARPIRAGLWQRLDYKWFCLVRLLRNKARALLGRSELPGESEGGTSP